MFESCCGRSVIEVLGEEKRDEDRFVGVRTDEMCFILQLWWCVRRTAGPYLYGRDLDVWREEATAFESSARSAQSFRSDIFLLRSRVPAERGCEGGAGAAVDGYGTGDGEVFHTKTWFNPSDGSVTAAVAMALLYLPLSVQVEGFLRKRANRSGRCQGGRRRSSFKAT